MSYKILGKEVGEIGYGMLGLTMRSEPPPVDKAIETLKTALECGCNYWNGGEFYGKPDYNSLVLLRKYFEKYPEDADKVVINIKGATKIQPTIMPDGSPEYVAESIENCLKMLGPRGRIDEFESARRDHRVPYETTIRAIDDFVQAGKIGGVACSEISAATLRKAASVVKVSSVEIELSLWQTEPLSNGLAEACAELGIVMLAYSPLGRGFLSGQIKSRDDIKEGDFRRLLPRFSSENFDTNIKLVNEIEKLAKKKGCTASQIAINWIRTLSKKPGMPVIIPIPGASTPERVRENATIVDLTDEDLNEIDRIQSSFKTVGDRYHKAGMTHLDTEH